MAEKLVEPLKFPLLKLDCYEMILPTITSSVDLLVSNKQNQAKPFHSVAK